MTRIGPADQLRTVYGQTITKDHTMVFQLEAPSGGSGDPLPDNATVTQMFVTEASGSFSGEALINRSC